MIHHITGTILATEPSCTIIDLHGLGLRVNTPPLSLTIGEVHTLHTHLIVRENALDLYGFASPDGRWLFEQLLTVPKVGPKTALQLLLKASETEVISAIARGNVTHFKQTTGTGGKTAENIINTLSIRMQERDPYAAVNPDGHTRTNTHQDAITALVSLGFSEHEAMERTAPFADLERIEDIITRALQQQ